MIVFALLAAALGIAAVVYLVVALVNPERLGPRPRGSRQREAMTRGGRG
ncbi:potassium-transporting ATPase subunit F [Agromyces sp. NPDC058104]